VGVGCSDLFGQMRFGVRLAMFLRTLGPPFLTDNPRLGSAFSISLPDEPGPPASGSLFDRCFVGAPSARPLVEPMPPTLDSPPHT
jgi:hypothetical protein